MRRTVVGLGTTMAGLTGSLILGAAPASADPGEVDLGLPEDFVTDGTPRTTAVQVTRTDNDCVRVQTLLAVQVPGLRRDDLEIAVIENDNWVPINTVQLTDDAVASVPVVPEQPQLCENQRVEVRYRLTFAPSAPDGRMAIIGEAFSAAGQRLDRATAVRQLESGSGATPEQVEATPQEEDDVAPEESDEAVPTPDGEESESAAAAPPAAEDQPPAGQNGTAGVDLASAAGQSTFFNGLGPLIIIVGVLMTGIGGVLLVTIVRRTRRGARDEDFEFYDADGPYGPVRARGPAPGLLTPDFRR